MTAGRGGANSTGQLATLTSAGHRWIYGPGREAAGGGFDPVAGKGFYEYT
jgi:hypothetical protein